MTRCSVLVGLFLGATVIVAQSKSAVPTQEIPTFKGTIHCEQGQNDVPVVAALGSSQVIGKVKCGEEVVVILESVKLAKTNDGLIITPDSVLYYSPSDQTEYSHIAFGAKKSQGWTKATVDLSPNQSYRIMLVGKAVDRSVCDNHGGYSNIDTSRTAQRFAVCKDGSRIRVE